MSKRIFFSHLAVLTVILSFSVFAAAQTKKDLTGITIKNFGQMDERFYRGGQPAKDEFQTLAELGVQTVIDLRDGPRKYEKPLVESLGMRYINLPMSDTKYPSNETVEAFLNLINDPETGIVFVHCKGGRHRTGAMGAVYRFTEYGWDYDRVYKEMKDYNFYTLFWKFGKIKEFVRDYAEKMEEETNRRADQ